MNQSRDTDVLIVGAGPTGLVLSLWLTRLGVRVRIIDKTAEPGTTSRALAVQARTLEFYRQIGIADGAVAQGRKTIGVNMWVAGKRAAHAVLGDHHLLCGAVEDHVAVVFDHVAVPAETDRGRDRRFVRELPVPNAPR